MQRLSKSAVTVLAMLLAGPAAAQAPASIRIRGDITAIDAHELHVTSRRGETFTLHLADDLRVSALAPIAIDAIKPGSFIGCAAVAGPNGTLLAREVHVLPEALRGTGEGHRPFDLEPGSTMTNGTVGDVVVANGRTLKVTYQGGEQTIVVPPDAPIVAYESGTREQLVPAAHVIVTAVEGPEATLTATRITVGKNGLVPPM